MLHTEARERLVEGYERMRNAAMTAEAYGVSERQVYKLVKQKRETGSVTLRTSQRGRKPKLSGEDLQRLKAEIEAPPDKTPWELKEEWKLPCSESRLSRIVLEKPGFRQKKMMIHVSEQERPDVEENRKKWKERIAKLPKTKLVFPDESGVNTNMTRRYGRAIGKQRVVDAVPLHTPQTTTVLSTMRLDRQFACRAFEGGTTKDHFLEYLREDLLPCLKKGDIVVMDNLRAHHPRGVEELLRSAGAVPLYLPPYSPDFNPIEKMWSKIKAILRKLRIRSQDLPVLAVREALSGVSASNCKGWFQCAGY